ncbi:nuclear transport factor 2 family protein [Micromonospora sp. CA-259024]|uniref:nuclear transport factor 2 family protein n=1 Tax=Micromonospora sp. CA-259024 TaxID=3239965 RepID=UPI003D90FEFD
MASVYDELAERYIATWNETDPARRRRDIDDLWAPEGRYVDPLAVAEGREAIDATIDAVQSQFPGMTFRLAGPVDGHHDQARFTWELGPQDAEALIVGFDVAVIDGDGRLTQVLGFLDRVPAGPAATNGQS